MHWRADAVGCAESTNTAAMIAFILKLAKSRMTELMMAIATIQLLLLNTTAGNIHKISDQHRAASASDSRSSPGHGSGAEEI
jgi:hypothetical protein